MALQGTGDLEVWYADRVMPAVGPTLAGSTGDFEAWAADRLMPETFISAAEEAPAAPNPRRRYRRFRLPPLDRLG